MKRTGQLWRALEATPILAGVPASWRRLAGTDFPALAPFLRPRQEPATTYASDEPEYGACVREVVVHAPDDVVAVCRCDRSCETLTLARADVVVYEMDLARLAAEVRPLLGITGHGGPNRSEGLLRTFFLGDYEPVAGHRFPAYLTVQNDADGFTSVVERLSARDVRPFLVVAPTAELVGPRCAEMLGARGSVALGLVDLVGIDERGRLATDALVERTLHGFRDRVIEAAAPPQTRDGMAFFATPPGSAWGDVALRFRDGHTVSVRVREERGIFSYAQMGMASKKNAEPTVQWTLLRSFARGNGLLTWQSPDATRENQKRRENLARDLGRFFRIDDDPIAPTEDGKGWRVRFSLHPES